MLCEYAMSNIRYSIPLMQIYFFNLPLYKGRLILLQKAVYIIFALRMFFTHQPHFTIQFVNAQSLEPARYYIF